MTLNTSQLSPNNSGIYMIHYAIDGMSSSNNTVVACSIFINGVENTKFNISTHFQQSTVDETLSFMGLVSLNASDLITLRLSADNVTTITGHNINVVVIRVG